MAGKDICEPCLYGKSSIMPMPNSSGLRVCKRLELMHLVLGGPVPEPSRGGALHFRAFTDYTSPWTDVVFLRTTSDTLAEYKKWMTKAQLQTGNKSSIPRSDNGGVYVSLAVKALYDEGGITHQTTVPDALQQNGVAESLKRVILLMARPMMRRKDLDQELWADTINTLVYIKNRVTSRALPVGNCPHEMLTGPKPDVRHMRDFVKKCWLVLHKSHIRDKPGDKASYGVLLGYPDNRKMYKVMMASGRVFKARRIVFSEKNTSDVAETSDVSPGDFVVEHGTIVDAGSSGEADDAQDEGEDG